MKIRVGGFLFFVFQNTLFFLSFFASSFLHLPLVGHRENLTVHAARPNFSALIQPIQVRFAVSLDIQGHLRLD